MSSSILKSACLPAVSKPVGRLQWVVCVVISKVFGELSRRHLLCHLAQERQVRHRLVVRKHVVVKAMFLDDGCDYGVLKAWRLYTPVVRLVFTTRSMAGSKYWSTTGSFSERVGTWSSMQHLEGAALMTLRRSSADILERVSNMTSSGSCSERSSASTVTCYTVQGTLIVGRTRICLCSRPLMQRCASLRVAATSVVLK